MCKKYSLIIYKMNIEIFILFNLFKNNYCKLYVSLKIIYSNVNELVSLIIYRHIFLLHIYMLENSSLKSLKIRMQTDYFVSLQRLENICNL